MEQPEERLSIQEFELPPLDVAALLHAFVLAPFEYFEDCLVKFPKLYSSGPYPLLAIVSVEIIFYYKTKSKHRVGEAC